MPKKPPKAFRYRNKQSRELIWDATDRSKDFAELIKKREKTFGHILSKPDHAWVSKALLNWSTGSGGAHPSRHLECTSLQLLISTSLTVIKYFTCLDGEEVVVFKLHCPHADCNKHALISAGLHLHVRQVLDLDAYYSLVTKYLECTRCKRKIISWSQVILDQLDSFLSSLHTIMHVI